MRILFKISGEALMGDKSAGTDHTYVRNLSKTIAKIVASGHEVALVNGGGNICRGEEFAEHGIAPNTAHGIGMLATVINSIVLQDSIISMGQSCNLYTARNIENIGKVFLARLADSDLSNKKVIIVAGGTGNPYFTTDTAAVLRGIELNCDMVVKCTNVDGIYDSDPRKNENAKRFDELSYNEAIEKNLRVMDQTALALARDHALKLAVCHIDAIDQFVGDTVSGINGTVVV